MATDNNVEIRLSARDDASKSIQNVKKSLGDMQSDIRNAGLQFAAASVATGLFTKSLIEAAGGYEQTQVAFTTMLGSAEKAKDMLAELAEFGKKTPFTISELEDNTKKLLAYGIAQEEIIPTMTTLGNLAAGVGKEKFPLLTLAFGQVKAAGKLTGAELRQFAESGIPLLDTLATSFGKTKGEIQEMISAGEVSFEDVDMALKGLTSEGGKFFNLMENQSKTFLGQLSNLEDQVILLSRSLGAFLLPVAGRLVEQFQKLMNWFNSLTEETKKAVAETIAFTAAFAGIAGAAALVVAAINPITVTMTLISTAFFLFRTHAEEIFAFFKDKFGVDIPAIVQQVQSAVTGFFEGLRGTFGSSQSDLQAFIFFVLDIAGQITYEIERVVATIQMYAAWAAREWNDEFEKIRSFTMEVIDAVITTALGMAETLQKSAQEMFQHIQGFLAFFGIDWGLAWEAISTTVGDVASYFLNEVVPVIQEFLDLVIVSIQRVVEIIGLSLMGLKTLWDVNFLGMRSIFNIFWEGLLAVFNVAWEVLAGAIDIALNLLKGNWEEAWKGVERVFTNVWKNIESFVQKVAKNIVDIIMTIPNAVQSALRALSSLPGFSGTFGSVSDLVNQAKSAAGNRATGGSVHAGMPYVVGEKRPELFVPNQSGRIIPGMGGGGITININGPVSSKEVAEEYGDAILRKLQFSSAVF